MGKVVLQGLQLGFTALTKVLPLVDDSGSHEPYLVQDVDGRRERPQVERDVVDTKEITTAA